MRRELGAALAALALVIAPGSASAEEPPPREPLVFVADPKMGVETTVRTTDSIGRVFFRYEDALPSVPLDERTFVGKATAVFGRGLKLVFFDEPLAELVTAASHEVGGHGGRARELSLEPTYAFYLPGIYRLIFAPDDHGEAGAYTQYLAPGIVEGDRAIVGTLGGLEANYVHAWWIQARILRSKGFVHHGDLLVYAASKLTYADSLLSPPSSNESSSNDVGSYVTELQDRANAWRVEDRRRISRRLGAAYLWNVLDPTLLYAFYGVLVEDLWRGKRTSRMPLPSIGGTTVLLSPRFGLTPFGAEQYLDLYLARGRTLLDGYVRVGTSGLYEYYGAGARLLGVRASERVSLGAEADVWRQPEMLPGERGVFAPPYRVGVNGAAYADLHLANIVGITGKLGAKTSGYVSGLPIDAGVHGYVGVTLVWP